jgi:hypothetical protein
MQVSVVTKEMSIHGSSRLSIRALISLALLLCSSSVISEKQTLEIVIYLPSTIVAALKN